MKAKLTLSVDNEVITKAKRYARKSGSSLSGLVENYLKYITFSDKGEFKISPKVNSLLGAIKVPENFDHRNELTDILTKKYTK